MALALLGGGGVGGNRWTGFTVRMFEAVLHKYRTHAFTILFMVRTLKSIMFSNMVKEV